MAVPFTSFLGGFAKGTEEQIDANTKNEEAWDKVAAAAFNQNLEHYNSVKNELRKKKEKIDNLTTIVGGNVDNEVARKVVTVAIGSGIDKPETIQRMYEQVKAIPPKALRPKAPAIDDTVPGQNQNKIPAAPLQDVTPTVTNKQDADIVPLPPKTTSALPVQKPNDIVAPNMQPIAASAVQPPVTDIPQDVLDASNTTDNQPDAAFSPAKVDAAIAEGSRSNPISSFFKSVFGKRTDEQREHQIVEKLSQVYNMSPADVRAIRAGGLPEGEKVTLPNGIDFKRISDDVADEKDARAITKYEATHSGLSSADKRALDKEDKLDLVHGAYQKARNVNPKLDTFDKFVTNIVNDPNAMAEAGLKLSDVVIAVGKPKAAKGSGLLNGFDTNEGADAVQPRFKSKEEAAAFDADPKNAGKTYQVINPDTKQLETYRAGN